MARVSLIPLNSSPSTLHSDRLGSFCHALMTAGHSVQVEPILDSSQDLVKQAVDAIRAALGSEIIVVDLAMNYASDDLVAVANQLSQGSASLVVAARRGRWFGPLLRRLTGSSDPFSGLAGLTQGAARSADAAWSPVGSRLTFEFLARLPGDRCEVLVNPVPAPRRAWIPLDDVRHAKRIADEKLGTFSRLLQFCFVGASGMVVDLSTYAALLALLSRTALHNQSILSVAGGNSVTLAEALAGLLSIATAIVWNFSLNRRLTFNDARRGSIVHQFARYVLSNLAGCAVSLAFRLLLPSRIPFFGRHRLAAAVTGIIAATGISFTLARWFVFTHRPKITIPSVQTLTEPIQSPQENSPGERDHLSTRITKSAQLNAGLPK